MPAGFPWSPCRAWSRAAGETWNFQYARFGVFPEEIAGPARSATGIALWEGVRPARNGLPEFLVPPENVAPAAKTKDRSAGRRMSLGTT